jgi:UPF0716 protein FxsA
LKDIMAILLFLAFVAVPIIEITVIIKVGGILGAWPTVGLIILTAAVGTTLVRAQGFQILARAQKSLNNGQFPAAEMVDGMGLLVAGVLLLTPGFVTDALGLALVIPPLRRAIAGLIWRWARRRDGIHMETRTWGSQGPRDANIPPTDEGVIEGEFTEIPPERLGRDDGKNKPGHR